MPHQLAVAQASTARRGQRDRGLPPSGPVAGQGLALDSVHPSLTTRLAPPGAVHAPPRNHPGESAGACLHGRVGVSPCAIVGGLCPPVEPSPAWFGRRPAPGRDPPVRGPVRVGGASASQRVRGGEHPRQLTRLVVAVVVIMGCGDACPIFPGTRYEDWPLDDPAGLGVEAVRPIRDEIGRRGQGPARRARRRRRTAVVRRANPVGQELLPRPPAHGVIRCQVRFDDSSCVAGHICSPRLPQFTAGIPRSDAAGPRAPPAAWGPARRPVRSALTSEDAWMSGTVLVRTRFRYMWADGVELQAGTGADHR